MRLLIAPFLAATLLTSAHAQVIPLDQVWGYNMPNTKDVIGIPFPEDGRLGGIQQTLASLTRFRQSGIEDFHRALAGRLPTDKATPGFVLPGKPNSAMLNILAAAVRPHGEKVYGRLNSLPSKTELTLVFFSHPLSYYCRLKKVEWDMDEDGNNVLRVGYLFRPHKTPESTVHFALIPLGELPIGKYAVDFEQLPMEEQDAAEGFQKVADTAYIVCQDFAFEVSDNPERPQPGRGR